MILILLWVLVLSVAAMIFFFSSESGAESSKTSAGVVDFLIHLFRPDFNTLPRAEQARLFQLYHSVVRKAAHFSEFALLGFFLRPLLGALKRKHRFLLSWGIGTLYACADELHQTLVAARAGMWQDVCLDSAGALAGTAASALLLYLYRRYKKSKKKAERFG